MKGFLALLFFALILNACFARVQNIARHAKGMKGQSDPNPHAAHVGSHNSATGSSTSNVRHGLLLRKKESV
jgi:hypothetical protein